MTRAADLTRRLLAELETEVADGGGGFTVTWVTQFTVRAQVTHLSGPTAQRQAQEVGGVVSLARVVVTIREDSNTRRIRPDWRLRDVSGGYVFDVLSVAPSESRGFIELFCERRQS